MAEARFVVVAHLEQLPDGALAPIVLDGHGLVIARRGDTVYAFQGTCPHEKADLAQGRLEDGRLVCPRHLATFSLSDGAVSAGWPNVAPLKLYPVQIVDGAVVVDAAAIARDPPGGKRQVWDLSR